MGTPDVRQPPPRGNSLSPAHIFIILWNRPCAIFQTWHVSVCAFLHLPLLLQPPVQPSRRRAYAVVVALESCITTTLAANLL